MRGMRMGMGSGGGHLPRPWAPLGGHLVRLKPAAGYVTLDGSNNASQLNDMDGLSNVSQATAAYRPAWVASDSHLNGRPSLHWVTAGGAGAIMYLQGSGLITAQPATLYIFGYNNSTATQNLCDGTSTSRMEIQIASSTTIGMYGGTAQITGSAIGSTLGGLAIAAVFNGSSSKLYVNNSASNLLSGNPGTASLSGIIIGETTFAPPDFRLGEYLVYGAAHTSAQVAANFAYAAQYFGISAS